jgi:glycosyltransferase involved in cell wall biosynthesis
MSECAAPLVSVVIPTYNHARYLGCALQSVLDQTYSNWEAIVIDNHSTDNTDEVMAGFADPRITYLKIHNNGVIAASRNAGIRAAKGEWIAFLDSDDWWATDKLTTCLAQSNDQIDLIYHGMAIVSSTSSFLKRKKIKSWQVKKPVIIDLLLRGNPIVNSSVVVRKTVLERIGGMNESVDMAAAEDYNTWLGISEISDRFSYIPNLLGNYLTHTQSISNKDMSIPTKNACIPFMNYLNENQLLKVESNFYLMKSVNNVSNDTRHQVRQGLIFCLLHGRFDTKLKAAIKLLRFVLS